MSKKQLTMCSLFDGSGTFCVAGKLAGIKPVSSSEIEPFPLRVTEVRLPEVEQLGNVCNINGAEIEPVDVITFGSPCFPAGTLVLTDNGYIDIKDIKIGMQVLTHTGSWKQVTDFGSKMSKTILLKGNHYGLECTPNHPIYSYSIGRNMYSWIHAEDMLNNLYGVPSYMESTNVEPVDAPIDLNTYFDFGRLMIQSDMDCNKIVEYKNNVISENLDEPNIPSWIYTTSNLYKLYILFGMSYEYGLTHSVPEDTVDSMQYISVKSKKLAEGIRLLAETVGYYTSIRKDTNMYIVQYSAGKDRVNDKLHSWYKVEIITELNEEKEVFNLTVEDDNSYIADGFIVHNCQDMSLAGRRAGLEGSRSCLFYDATRIIREMREKTNGKYPRYAVWENVCFDGDTLITCKSGYKRIRDVSVGDYVKTHTGRYMPVAKVHQTKKQKVLKLKVSGAEDVYVTPNHPFLAIEKLYSGKRLIGTTTPDWVTTDKLTKHHLIGYRIDIPTLPDDFITEYEAWTVGRWLADGSVDLNRSNPRIFISVGIGKEIDAREHLSKLKYKIYENKPHETATNFCFTSHEFYTLIADAGIGAGNKRVPQYVFQLPYKLQKQVLKGYLSGDGHIRQRHHGIELSAGTASRELSYGIARLIRNVYRVASNISVSAATDAYIDGRKIHANYPCYSVNATIDGKTTTSIINEDVIWQPVKSVEPVDGNRTVYNLSVLEDNTYAANDIIVHNCGAISSNKGEDFRAVLEEMCRIKDRTATVPKSDKWQHAGLIMGTDYSVAWRLFDAQYWGVPQRRQRIYLVADFNGKCAKKILFESEGLSRYSKASIDSWKETTRNSGNSTETTSRYVLNDQGGQIMYITDNITATFCATSHPPIIFKNNFDNTVPDDKYELYENHGQDSRYTGPLDVSSTVTANYSKQNAPFVLDTQKVYGICSEKLNSMNSDNPDSGFFETDISKTLDTSNQSPAKNQGGIAIVETQNTDTYVFENHSQDLRFKQLGDIAPTVTATYGMGGNNQPFVVTKTYDITMSGKESTGRNVNIKETDVSKTLDTNCYHPMTNQGDTIVVSNETNQTDSTYKTYDLRVNGKSPCADEVDVSRTVDTWIHSPLSNQGGILVVSDTDKQTENENIQNTSYTYDIRLTSENSEDVRANVYETDTSRTLDSTSSNPCRNQGGLVIVQNDTDNKNQSGDDATIADTHSYGIDRPAFNQGYNAKFSFQIDDELSPTIVSSGPGAVAHPVYSASKNYFFTHGTEELAETLLSSDYKDPPLVTDYKTENRYIVRRLTPQECALLQGMPTWWCANLGEENPSKEEIDKWITAFAEYNKAIGKDAKPKTEKQICKWLQNPYSDSAEYKMWGNGVAMPNAFYVLAGIAWSYENDIDDDLSWIKDCTEQKPKIHKLF